MPQIQCPNCGSFETKPVVTDYVTDAIADSPYGKLVRLFLGKDIGSISFRNPQYIQKFMRKQVSARCFTCALVFDADTVIDNPTTLKPLPTSQVSSQQVTTEERLSELERLREKGIVTDDEYKRKRDEILRDL